MSHITHLNRRVLAYVEATYLESLLLDRENRPLGKCVLHDVAE